MMSLSSNSMFSQENILKNIWTRYPKNHCETRSSTLFKIMNRRDDATPILFQALADIKK